MTDMYAKSLKCKGCGQPLAPIDAFPGGICLECHAKKPDKPMTGAELANMFRKAVKR